MSCKDARTLLLLTMLVTFSMAQARARDWPIEFIDDADLHSVRFVDAQTGWAVGDRGAIWHTQNGGSTWQRQSSPLAQRFSAVQFLDAKHGWIASGAVKPYRLDGAGFVLSTDDGGQTWQQMKLANLSFLYDLSVRDQEFAVAVGSRWPMFPAGVFQTKDGGRSWHPFGVATNDDWVACDVSESGRILLVGAHQATAVQSQHPQQGTDSTDLASRLRAGCWMGDRAFVAGDNGTLLAMIDDRWLDASRALPPVAKQFDFHAVAQSGSSLWLAGAPGNMVWRSDDGGRRWMGAPTGITTPIYDLCFVDEQHGWAVGALGVILATIDGGQTWKLQRNTQRRLGALVISTSSESLPWSVLAHVSAEHQIRSRAVIIETAAANEPTYSVDLSDRLHEAAVDVGAGGADCWTEFPVLPQVVKPNPDVIEAGWALHQGPLGFETTGTARLKIKLARAIRQWQPEMIMLQAETERTALSQLLVEATVSAQQLAADGQTVDGLAALPPWRTTRILQASRQPPAPDLKTKLMPTRLSLPLGMSIGELAARAATKRSPAPRRIGPVYLASVVGPALRADLGTQLSADQDMRRVARPESQGSGSLDALARAAQQQENAHALLERAVSQQDVARSLQLVSELPAPAAARMLFVLAERHRASSDLNRCQQTLASVEQQYPQLTAASQATAQRLTLAVSEEAAVRSKHASAAGQPATDPQSRIVQTTHVMNSTEQTQTPDQLFANVSANLRGRPELQLALASLDDSKKTISLLSRLKQSAPTRDWRLSAAAEVWLRDRTRSAPKPIWTCQLAARPKLDGQLDEPLWGSSSVQQLEPLRELNHPLATKIWIARDDRFLYLAAKCQRLPEITYPALTKVRPRDTEPGQLDRVDFFLDVNRDYQTGWRLGFDSRGWAIDSESGDVGWNPQWFVASQLTEQHWIVEAAIPLQELVRDPTNLAAAWVLGVRRVVPGWGWQAWPTGASAEPAWQELGLLLFDSGP